MNKETSNLSIERIFRQAVTLKHADSLGESFRRGQEVCKMECGCGKPLLFMTCPFCDKDYTEALTSGILTDLGPDFKFDTYDKEDPRLDSPTVIYDKTNNYRSNESG